MEFKRMKRNSCSKVRVVYIRLQRNKRTSINYENNSVLSRGRDFTNI